MFASKLFFRYIPSILNIYNMNIVSKAKNK